MRVRERLAQPHAARAVYVPYAGILLLLYCLLRRRTVYCMSASRLARFSRRVVFFDTCVIPKYYAKHIFHERRIVDQCDPTCVGDGFAYQHYVSDVLAYLIPYYILCETREVQLIAPWRLRSDLFPKDTWYMVSLRDAWSRLQKARCFAYLYLAIQGDRGEFSYIPFPGSTRYRVGGAWWTGVFHGSDVDFYQDRFQAMVDALSQVRDLEAIASLSTRRFRTSVDFSENVAFQYCEATGKIARSEQQRAIVDFAIEYSFSHYHEYCYWDSESRRILEYYCRGNTVVHATFVDPPETIAAVPYHTPRVRSPCRVLAFPAQIESTGFSNSSHTDVHLASEFREFLEDLRDADFDVTVKLKDPEDARYFPDFVCIVTERGDYLALVSQYDCFVSCGYTTPGIALRVKGLRSFYFYPQTGGHRLYADMTMSSVREFVALLGPN